MILPDQPVLDHLRKQLWNGREFGQSAVMIGAGLSRNAEKMAPSAPEFPTWRELGYAMFDRLRPQGTENESTRLQARKRAASGTNVLDLAERYEKRFGRPSLSSLLLELIPDQQYRPGPLHELLLKLPWSDVFTTNYDTLLERTLPTVYEQKYDVINASADIPGRMKPRIVKLHGSFPSHRPFVITKSDYRKYPAQSAAFVNIVQQSMMENAFCLMGFSGDDPNFLYWSNWVRENLGENAPRIYLICFLPPSASRRRKFADNVVTVDLAPVVREVDWLPPDIRYSRALEWFLNYLLLGKPPETSGWPHPPERLVITAPDGLPPFPGQDQPATEPTVAPERGTVTAAKLQKLREAWTEERTRYPGWLVAPRRNRDTLLDSTKYWIESVFDSAPSLSPPDDLALLYELSWRMGTCMLPLSDQGVRVISNVLDAYCPFPGLPSFDHAGTKHRPQHGDGLDWPAIGEWWVDLAFAVASDARENGDEAGFRRWMGRLEGAVRLRTVWQARWHHEQCLTRFFCLDEQGARNALAAWPENGALPHWEAKRAAVYAELGELGEARRIAEGALAAIRARADPYTPDFAVLSDEGWIMLLLKVIGEGNWIQAGDPDTNKSTLARNSETHYRNRWDRLEKYGCNPWTEIDWLRTVLAAPAPILLPDSEEKIVFDPWERAVVHNLAQEPLMLKYRPAFTALRIFSRCPLPLSCGEAAGFYDIVGCAARWLAPLYPLWAVSSMVRGGSETAIEEFFDRTRVATLPAETTNILSSALLGALAQAIQNLRQAGRDKTVKAPPGRWSRQLAVVLSLLCFRFTPEALDGLLDTTLAVYWSDILRTDPTLRQPFGNLLIRILYALQPKRVLGRMHDLLRLPVPDYAETQTSAPAVWDDPFLQQHWLDGVWLDRGFARSTWDDPVGTLIRMVGEGSPGVRRLAVHRLARLHEIGGLRQAEQRAFGRALWARIDQSSGLPADTGFFACSLLHLPEPQPLKAKNALREFLTRGDFARSVAYTSDPEGTRVKEVMILGAGGEEFLQDWLHSSSSLFVSAESLRNRLIDWTLDEVCDLLRKAAAWWDHEKAGIRKSSRGEAHDLAGLRQRLSGLSDLVSIVILPKSRTDQECCDLATRLLSEMEDFGFSIERAWPALLFANPGSVNDIASRLHGGLTSMETAQVSSTAEGIYRWLRWSQENAIPPPPEDLLKALVQRLLIPGQPAPIEVIRMVAAIVRYCPGAVTGDLVDSLRVALSYLAEETSLPEQSGQEPITAARSALPMALRPEYRRVAAELAAIVYGWYEDSTGDVPAAIAAWKETWTSDVLPEVRRVWLRTMIRRGRA